VVELGAQTHSGAQAMAPDGRSFALDTTVGGKRRIILYETATLRPRLAIPLEYGYTNRLVFSPEGRFLAAAHIDGTVLVWDVRALEL
jgi:WD40 repeat protein